MPHTHTYSFRHVMDDSFLLQRLVKYNSLDLFINSFLGMIPSIWATIPLTLRERGVTEGWSALLQFLQRHVILTLDCYICIFVCSHHVFDTVKKQQNIMHDVSMHQPFYIKIHVTILKYYYEYSTCMTIYTCFHLYTQ